MNYLVLVKKFIILTSNNLYSVFISYYSNTNTERTLLRKLFYVCYICFFIYFCFRFVQLDLVLDIVVYYILFLIYIN
jgi:hypothetical protein